MAENKVYSSNLEPMPADKAALRSFRLAFLALAWLLACTWWLQLGSRGARLLDLGELRKLRTTLAGRDFLRPEFVRHGGADPGGQR